MRLIPRKTRDHEFLSVRADRHLCLNGSDVTAFLDSKDGQLLAVRFDNKHHHVPTTGEVMDIHFPRNRFDLFDAASEKRI